MVKYPISLKRKLKGKTDYKKRLKLVASGKTRLVIRKSLKHISIQFISYCPTGDKVLMGITTKHLKKLGWNHYTRNTPSAYLAGLLAGAAAQKEGINEAILDIGLYAPIKGSIIFAALKGIVDAGVNVPYNPKIIPQEERIMGEHISKNIKNDFEKLRTQILRSAQTVQHVK